MIKNKIKATGIALLIANSLVASSAIVDTNSTHKVKEVLDINQISFSEIESKLQGHSVYQKIKVAGFIPGKTLKDKDGMVIVSGVIPASIKPDGKKTRAENVNFFTTENGKYMIFGNIIKTNGEKLEAPIPPVDVSILKGKEAFTMGTGTKQLYIFSDPDCPGCRNLFNRIDKDLLKKYTMNYFMFPLRKHKEAKAKSLFVLSQPKDKRMGVYQLVEGSGTKMTYKGPDVNITEEAINSLKENTELARKVKLTHTPFILDENGKLLRSIN